MIKVVDQEAILRNVIDHVFVDTSQGTVRYIAVSHNKRYIQLSASAYTILKQVCDGASFATIAQTISTQQNATITPEEIQAAYFSVFDKISKLVNEPRSLPWSFWIHFQLIPAKMVTAIASRFAFLFHPLASSFLLSNLIIFSLFTITRHFINVPQSSVVYGEAYLLFLFSLVIHEFGHAAACFRGGMQPSEIGFTIYLVFPAFYSDVSAAWQMEHWKRVRVDVGGIYFQLCFVGTLYLALYLFSGIAVFLIAFLMILGTCVVNLNPFAKFDGYWILSDLLNVNNLSRQPLKIWLYWCRSIYRRPYKKPPFSSFISMLIALYGVVRIVFWIAFIITSGPMILRALHTYPSLHVALIGCLPRGCNLSTVSIWAANSFLLFVWGMMAFRSGRLLLLLLKRGCRI